MGLEQLAALLPEKPEDRAQKNRERFNALLDGINRDGMNEFRNWLNSSDFFTAPASTRYHGNYAGGLLEHSLNVYDQLEKLLPLYADVVHVPEESVRIASLFHDLCKVNFYSTEKRNRKNEHGQWESYDAYTIKEKMCYGGHGSKSVFILQNFIKLTVDEAVAINCHMGASDGNKDVGNAYEQFPFAWLVHVADEAAAFIIEKKEK